MEKMLENLTVFIPTWNAARHLGLTLDYYAQFGIAPTLVVDNKTDDNTLEVGRIFGCRTIVSHNPTMRSQYLIEKGARAISTPWALRMDDDELPTRTMLNFVAELIDKDNLAPETIVGFPRFQCFIHEEKLFASTRHTSLEHRQWRLFRPEVVQYTERGHTPGFEVPEQHRLPAPDLAAMLHFDWVVRTAEERTQKIARYDAHTRDHGSVWRDYYLADTLAGFEAELAPLNLPECDNFVTALRTLRKQLSLD
jgi:glycosyltransferase involved in cell wall biosynthesis